MFGNRTTSQFKLFLALVTTIFTCAWSPSVRANTQVWAQDPNPAGGQYKSAWYPPDGMDGDEYSWDSFTLASNTAISEVRWRGAYTNYLSGAGRAPVFDFTVAIYRSIAGNSQPDLGTGGRLVSYTVGGNAGEVVAGSAGGVIMYDYAFSLPTPFQAVAGTTYWIQIEASQGVTPTYYWPPDWSMAASTAGNNSHFRRITGGPIQTIGGDLAFSLWASSAPTVNIAASAAPAGAGTISGAGSYPINSTASLTASPNTGWGFVNWTEGAAQVSTNPHYTFQATVNRTLVAHFTPAYTIVTFAQPTYGGTITGAGVYNQNATVTLTATPNPGFVFGGWSDGAMTATHTFPATSDLWITGFFDPDPLSVSFDFDNAPVHTSLPVSLSSNGLTAVFTGTNQNFSIQPANTLGFTPAGFGGLCIYPNSVFAADLHADFSDTLSYFSIMYSPQELGCDTSAIMRVTAYMNGVAVGTNTATAPTPGTWPTGTLSISVPSGFNSVVVQHNTRPATCQDWGPIFLADNVLVTRVCFPCGPTCDTIDFNSDGLFPDTMDIDDFLSVFSGGPCSNDPNCGDIDFNNDGLFPDTADIDALLSVFSGGPCL